jgi:NAD+ synthase (glutamine-hydrolysing)
MRLIKVAAAVLNQTPLAWDSNRDHIVAAIGDARRQGASILCLPELCLTGYGCEDEFHSRGLQQLALEVLAEVLPETRGMVVSVGLPLLHQNALFDAAALCVDGRLCGFVCKRFLAGDGIHYEPRWFKPWPHGERATILALGKNVPLGDVHFDVGGVTVGFEICEDAWAASRPGGALAEAGVDVILNPSASHFAFGKHDVRQRFVLEGSRAFGVTYVYANLLGNEAGRAIYDGGALIASNGRLCARGARFSYAAAVVTSAVVDLDEGRMARARTQSFNPRPDERGSRCVPVDFAWPDLEPTAATTDVAPWERSPRLKEEEFTRAVALGLFDYLRKSRSEGFVVSLSGGADSAGVACLVAAAVSFGVAELGVEAFRSRLAYARRLQGAAGVRDLVHALLLCVYQATENSSAITRDAARAVAEAVGAEFLVLDVGRQVQGYVDLIARATGRALDWDHDDLALQNIQARTRAPTVWLLANLRHALLLATSNRSEAAVGYATMDGDTCGGLSPIAGIDKAFVRRWLSWLEREGPAGLGALPPLAAVTAQAPTAELRPAAAHQTDEDDLMPYEVLDAVERAAIRDKHTPLEVFREARVRFPAVPAERLLEWVERFFRLWCRNQWKRERYAPSFHVDDENLDPKSWCRFPVLSGGFERELRELREYAAKAEPRPTSSG